MLQRFLQLLVCSFVRRPLSVVRSHLACIRDSAFILILIKLAQKLYLYTISIPDDVRVMALEIAKIDDFKLVYTLAPSFII